MALPVRSNLSRGIGFSLRFATCEPLPLSSCPRSWISLRLFRRVHDTWLQPHTLFNKKDAD
jgi:hypothetical protein